MSSFSSRFCRGVCYYRCIVFGIFFLIGAGAFGQEMLFPDQGVFPGTWVVNCGGLAWLVVWDSENYSPGWVAFRPGQDDIYISLTSRMPSGTIIWTISNPGGGVATDPVNPSTGLTLDFFRSAALYVLADAGIPEEDMASGRYSFTVLDSSDFSTGWGDCTGQNPGLDCVAASIAPQHVSSVTVSCTIWELGLPFRVNGVLTLSTKNLTIRATMNCESLVCGYSTDLYRLGSVGLSNCAITSFPYGSFLACYWLTSGSSSTPLSEALSCPPVKFDLFPCVSENRGNYFSTPQNIQTSRVLQGYRSSAYTVIVPLLADSDGRLLPYDSSWPGMENMAGRFYLSDSSIYIEATGGFHKILSFDRVSRTFYDPYSNSGHSNSAVVIAFPNPYASNGSINMGGVMYRFFFIILPSAAHVFENDVSGLINQSITVDVQPITDLLQEIREILQSQSNSISPEQLSQLLSSIDSIESAIYEAQFSDNVSDSSALDSAADQVSSSISFLRDALLQQQGVNNQQILDKLNSLNAMVSQFFSVQSGDLPDMSGGYPGPDYSDANAWSQEVGGSLQGTFSGLSGVFTAVFSRETTCGTWTIPIPEIAVTNLGLPDDSVTLDFNEGLLSLISGFCRVGTSVILLQATLFGIYRLFFRSVTGAAANSGGGEE